MSPGGWRPAGAGVLDGRLALTTPEGVRLLLTPAGPSVRARAWLIDLLLWLVIYLLMLWANYAWVPGARIAEGLAALLAFVTYWGYPVLWEVYGGGRSPGKRALGIQVLRADGLPVGWRESILRNLLLVADFLPFLYCSGLICMFFDTRFRRLGDLVAGTQVVYRERVPQRMAAPGVEAEPLPFPLSPEQQRMLTGLIERESRLPPARLLELATLAEPLTGLTGRASLERLRAYVAGLVR